MAERWSVGVVVSGVSAAAERAFSMALLSISNRLPAPMAAGVCRIGTRMPLACVAADSIYASCPRVLHHSDT